MIIDTIHIRINLKEDLIQGPDYKERIKGVITLLNDGRNHKTGLHYYYGQLRNFKINISGDNVIIMGSIAKYYYGTNFGDFSRGDLYQALKDLSAELGINVERGYLFRVDIAEDLFLKEDPSKYRNLMINIPRAKTWTQINSKYVERSWSKCLIYDKGKELENNDSDTYKELKKTHPGANILRFEVSFKNLSTQFKGFGKARVALLHSTSFLTALAESWFKHYQTIEKVRENKLSEVKTLKQLKIYRKNQGTLNMGGLQQFIIDTNKLMNENNWNKKDTAYYKQTVKTEFNVKSSSVTSPLIAELDAAIQNSETVKTYIKN